LFYRAAEAVTSLLIFLPHAGRLEIRKSTYPENALSLCFVALPKRKTARALLLATLYWQRSIQDVKL